VSAIPLYPRPYQTIPFQWSLHCVDTHGAVTHQEFLGDARSDPRRSFVESLLASLRGTKLPVIVYSSYEQARLTELASAFPGLGKPIRSVVRQLVDLLPVVRSCVYHPEFDFSSSIKVAAPALCPDVTYDDLEEIADGNAASTAFWLIASGRAEAEMSARSPRVAGLLSPGYLGHGEVASSAQCIRSALELKLGSFVRQSLLSVERRAWGSQGCRCGHVAGSDEIGGARVNDKAWRHGSALPGQAGDGAGV